MARFVLVHLLLLTFVCSHTQIVNIESKRMQSDTTGWMGSAGASFALLKNVQEVLSINATAHLQHKNNKNLYLLLTNYNLLRGDGKKITVSVMGSVINFNFQTRFSEANSTCQAS